MSLCLQVLEPLWGSVLPTLFGAGRLSLGTPFVMTSLVKGTPLSDLLEIPLAVRVAARTALARIHALGAAHGDIRLANMLLVDGHDTSGGDKSNKGDISSGLFESSCPVPLCGQIPDVGNGNFGSDGGSGGSGSGIGAGEQEAGYNSSCPQQRSIVVVVDLGRAYMGARPKEYAWEMARLKSLLGE